MTPTGITFSVVFAYLEGEHLNNILWALEWFRGIFLIRDALPGVIVTNIDLALMDAVKFLSLPICCVSFTLIRMWRQSVKPWLVKRNAWNYVMEAWGSYVDCPFEQDFDECLMMFEIDKNVMHSLEFLLPTKIYSIDECNGKCIPWLYQFFVSVLHW